MQIKIISIGMVLHQDKLLHLLHKSQQITDTDLVGDSLTQRHQQRNNLYNA